jgi:hypothetical protein
MSARNPHVPIDRLTALAFVAPAADTDQDRQALTHISRCRRCAGELARLTAEADALRDAAFAQVDAHFDDARLDAQRTRILDRLAHLGQAARVLRFPQRTRDVAMPVSTSGRRWVSVAAAAGLIIGLVAGQLLHFVSSDAFDRDQPTTLLQSGRPTGALLVPASAQGPSLSDDELLDEIEAAVQLRRAQSLRALDAMTPIASDFRDVTLGR